MQIYILFECSFLRYYSARGKLISKAAKYPHLVSCLMCMCPSASITVMIASTQFMACYFTCMYISCGIEELTSPSYHLIKALAVWFLHVYGFGEELAC